MSRLFEMKSKDGAEDVEILIDLDSVCSVRVERRKGNFPSVMLRFVGGQEVKSAVPDNYVDQFLAAYRARMSERLAPR